MIISGGFNVFPSDLEAVVRAHPAVAEVVGGRHAVAALGRDAGGLRGREGLAGWSPASCCDGANERLGKVQRLAALELVPELPRNAIGKVLKRTLRDAWQDRLHL